MTASTELQATPRVVTGKTSKKLGHVGQVPAVLYGAGREPQPLALDRHEFDLFSAHHQLGSTIVELKIEGEKKAINAMVREVQTSPVKGTVLHVDLLEVSMNKSVHAVLALHLNNDPIGVREGGTLNVSVHELNVEAKPGDLPDAIEVDVAEMAMGDSLHLRDIPAPKGVTFLDDGDAIIASVTAPKVEAEGVEEEITEPTVIGQEESAE